MMNVVKTNNRGGESSALGLIIAFILGILILISVIYLMYQFFPNFFYSIGLFGNLGYVSTESIMNSCKLACLEGNSTLFCEKERKWEIGDGRVIEGTCYSISKVKFNDISSVASCNKEKVSCNDEKNAICKLDKKIVDCSLI
jgi:hypothetical protein